MSLECTLIVGYIYSSIVAAFFITPMMYLLSENTEDIEYFEERKRLGLSKGKSREKSIGCLGQWEVSMVGIIERCLYLTSILVGKPEFIIAWLGIKTVVWSLSDKDVLSSSYKYRSFKRKYNNFLAGNGISILYAFAGFGIIQWSTGSFLPSATLENFPILNQNISLAWASALAPIFLALILIGCLPIIKKLIYQHFNEPSHHIP